MAPIDTMSQKRAFLLSKISPHKKDISQLTQLTSYIIAISFLEVTEAAPFADVLQNKCS